MSLIVVHAVFLPIYYVLTAMSLCSADTQVTGENERSREQILQTLSDLSRGFQDIADRCLLVLHLEVRYAEKETHPFVQKSYSYTFYMVL